MNFEKIEDHKLFSNNTEQEIKEWVNTLQFFYFLKARAGHNCEGDKFAMYIKYSNIEELTDIMADIGIVLKEMEQDAIAFDPFGDISMDKLDKIRYAIPEHPSLEQPQSCILFGIPVHIWVQNHIVEIALSGATDGNIYKVSSADFENCLKLETKIQELKWGKYLDKKIEQQAHCISLERYPELKTTCK